MIPLVMSDADKQKAAAIVEYAKTHRLDFDALKMLIAGLGPFPADDPNRVLDFPFGFVACYTIEQHPQKGSGNEGFKWLRHFSLGLDVPGRSPSLIAVEMIAEMFGMPPMKECTLNIIKEPIFTVNLFAELKE